MLMLKSILAILVVLLPILMVIAFVTIAERKIMGSMQRRCGPNAVGFEKKNYIFQTKRLFHKSPIFPSKARGNGNGNEIIDIL